VLGVLLVRQRQPRRFDDADEAFLSTVASQLGGAIAFAKASGELCAACHPAHAQPRCLEGRPGAPGIALGRGLLVFSASEIDSVPDRQCTQIAEEKAHFLDALDRVREQALALNTSLEGRLADADRALFNAFAMILDSPEIRDSVLDGIEQGNWAPGAVRQAIASNAKHFEALDDAYLRERANDVRALGGRLIAQLLGEPNKPAAGGEAKILIGKQLSAMDIGEALSGDLQGIVSADGSTLSHAAIVARSLGIPAVMGVNEAPLTLLDGQLLIIDGNKGRIHLHATPATRRAVEREIAQQQARHAALEPIKNSQTRTRDGKRIHLFTNAGLTSQPDQAKSLGSDGIGLFRSELPFMMFERLPSEAEQLDIYRSALASVAPLPFVLRTLDAGGDKPLPYLSESESNPALGWRGIRFALDHPDVFLTQLRAALRANLGLGNLRLLLPMISTQDEVAQVKRLIKQAMAQLAEQQIIVSRPPIGIMIEVPAAVLQADLLAGQVDFLSVGTNDLAQYLLATDRNNPRVSAHLNPCHPSLLKALQLIASAALRTGKPVSVCGEMASDPAMAMVLAGMGFDGLSINPPDLLTVKWAMLQVNFHYMQSLAQQCLLADDASGIQRLLQEAAAHVGLQPSANAETQSASPLAETHQL
jgi:phosphotransferase system enzyme I (PtsP)